MSNFAPKTVKVVDSNIEAEHQLHRRQLMAIVVLGEFGLVDGVFLSIELRSSMSLKLSHEWLTSACSKKKKKNKIIRGVNASHIWLVILSH
jgi:hypothetical protein